MNRRKTIYTEEVFLLSTFSEFLKCWKSSRRSRLFIDSVNGQAFVNFSVFLGNPSDVHFHSTPRQRNPPPEGKKQRKKSPKKIQRDNERAAKFQEKKRQEEAAAKAASGVPTPATSSPAASSISSTSVNFSFASPVPEDVTNGTVEGISGPQPSPEHLRQQQEDQSSLSASLDEEIDRENSTSEPSLENITITDEVLQENEKSASEETESPGLDFEDTDTYRRVYGNPILKAFRFRFVNSGEKKEEWVRESKWYKTNWNKISSDEIHEGIMMSVQCEKIPLPEEKILKILKRFDQGIQLTSKKTDYQMLQIYRRHQQGAAFTRFQMLLLECEKPKLLGDSIYEEPCSSPALIGCACHSGATGEGEQY